MSFSPQVVEMLQSLVEQRLQTIPYTLHSEERHVLRQCQSQLAHFKARVLFPLPLLYSRRKIGNQG